jgi:hypothetical protein
VRQAASGVSGEVAAGRVWTVDRELRRGKTMNIIKHPHQDLMAEAKREREVVESPEAQALLKTLMDAARAYWDFLDRNDLIDEFTADGEFRIKATALVVTVTLDGTTDVTLKDGACHRVYGNGQNPDPCGAGPGNIPHQPRDDI